MKICFKNFKKKIFLISFGVLIVLFSLGLTVVMLRADFSASIQMQEEQEAVTDASAQETKGYFRVLVAGVDRVSGLSDVLMLVSLNRDSGEAWILQIPRDTYARYTDRSYKKLNGAPQTLGGMAQAKRFLSEALGLSIDRYVRLSPDVLRDAVDALGGVEIELERAMHYDDPEQGLSIHLPKGKQTLSGAQAEQLVRYRSGYLRGDLERIDTQKLFLSAFFAKVKSSLSPMRAIRLAAAFLGKTETDLTISDVTALIGDAFVSLRAEQVFFVTAPGMDATAKSGASYYALSRPAMEELLRLHFGLGEGDFDPESVFLNRNNEEFRRIYGQYIEYDAVCANAT